MPTPRLGNGQPAIQDHAPLSPHCVRAGSFRRSGGRRQGGRGVGGEGSSLCRVKRGREAVAREMDPSRLESIVVTATGADGKSAAGPLTPDPSPARGKGNKNCARPGSSAPTNQREHGSTVNVANSDSLAVVECRRIRTCQDWTPRLGKLLCRARRKTCRRKAACMAPGA